MIVAAADETPRQLCALRCKRRLLHWTRADTRAFLMIMAQDLQFKVVPPVTFQIRDRDSPGTSYQPVVNVTIMKIIIGEIDRHRIQLL
jgi:hypothetical protein